MQNKANFGKAKMKLNFYSTKDYENQPRLPARGKQTQSKPISKAKNAVAKIEPAQSVSYAFSLARTLLYAIILGRRNYQQLEGCVMRHNEHGTGRLNDYEYC